MRASKLLLFSLLFTACGFAQGGGCLLRANAAGPVRLGMTFKQARAALQGFKLKPSEDSEKLPILIVMHDKTRIMDIYGDEEGVKDNSKIEDFRVYDPTCRTADGVHVGLLISEVEKIYGRVTRMLVTDTDKLEEAEFEKQPDWIQIEVGHGEAGVYPKGKRCSKQYVPTAHVISVWVSHPGVAKAPNDDNTCNVPASQKH